jgi:hypothetical protein
MEVINMMKTRSITLRKRLSQLVTNVINLANQWAKNYVMPYEKVFKMQAQQINMVEDDNDGDSNYNDLVGIIETTIATIDLNTQMLIKTSEHKEDNWYVDFGAHKHVMGNSSLLHGIVKTQSSSSVISTSGHTHGVEGKGHAKLRLNGLMKKIINVF